MTEETLRRSRARLSHARCVAMIAVVAASCVVEVAAAHAAGTLTVDLSSAYRTATHVGNGSLYGVTEKIPGDGDLQRLVGDLHPRMFTNPASSGPGTQQPGVPANALKVAARLAPFGASVTVRLADWFSGWYAFTSMSDWLDKVSTTIAAKKAAKLNNIYAYELWNEPNGSWTNGGDTNAVPGGTKTLSFNAFWKQTYDKVRQLDPDVKITGPSLSYMDPTFISGFLTYCKANNCLPDTIGWHEGMNIEGDVAAYRNLEKQLGVGPLLITINEYSGAGRINDEGRPGASIPLIAQLERSGVDSACISWWTPDSMAGHLGSLLASDTQPNGGWFVYKWYGEMSGSMVATTSSLAKDGKNLDGVASIDTSARSVSVILGGLSDGTVHVVIKGFKAAPFFGSTVHVAAEHAPWKGRTGVVAGTDVLSSSDLALANDQVTIAIGNVNGDDGYRVVLTQVGSSADGGVAAWDSGSTIRDGNAPDRADVPPDLRPAGDGQSASDPSVTGGAGGGLGGTGGGGGTSGAGGSSKGEPSNGGGCSCSVPSHRKASGLVWLLSGLLVLQRRARRVQKSQSDPFSRELPPFRAGRTIARSPASPDGSARQLNERPML